MNRINLAVMFVFALLAVSILCADPIWDKADSLYQAGQFRQAQTTFASLDSLGVVDPQLYLALGNCEFELRRWPQAVYQYRRCLRYQPTNRRAKDNLALALARLDKDDARSGTWLASFLRNLYYLLGINTMLLLGILFLAGASGLWWLHLRRLQYREDYRAITGAVACLVLFIIFSISAWRRGAELNRVDTAVVLAKSIGLYSGPDDQVAQGQLSGGETLQLLDKTNSRRQIKTATGSSGWVAADSVAVVQ